MATAAELWVTVRASGVDYSAYRSPAGAVRVFAREETVGTGVFEAGAICELQCAKGKRPSAQVLSDLDKALQKCASL